jgi:hypothetical protein
MEKENLEKKTLVNQGSLVKRIKTKQDLINALCEIYEDMSTFNLELDARSDLNKVINKIRWG